MSSWASFHHQVDQLWDQVPFMFFEYLFMKNQSLSPKFTKPSLFLEVDQVKQS